MQDGDEKTLNGQDGVVEVITVMEKACGYSTRSEFMQDVIKIGLTYQQLSAIAGVIIGRDVCLNDSLTWRQGRVIAICPHTEGLQYSLSCGKYKTKDVNLNTKTFQYPEKQFQFYQHFPLLPILKVEESNGMHFIPTEMLVMQAPPYLPVTSTYPHKICQQVKLTSTLVRMMGLEVSRFGPHIVESSAGPHRNDYKAISPLITSKRSAFAEVFKCKEVKPNNSDLHLLNENQPKLMSEDPRNTTNSSSSCGGHLLSSCDIGGDLDADASRKAEFAREKKSAYLKIRLAPGNDQHSLSTSRIITYAHCDYSLSSISASPPWASEYIAEETTIPKGAYENKFP